MKNLKHSHFLITYALIAFVLIALFSCKKEIRLKIVEPLLSSPIKTPIVTGIYIPIKFEAEGLNLSLKYKDNTNLLEEITDDKGNKTIITYTVAQQPKKLEKYKNEKLFYIVYYEQLDKKPTSKALIFDYKDSSGTYIPTGYYTLTYNAHQNISTVHYFNNSNKMIKTNDFHYAESENLLETSTIAIANSSAITNYTFDTKKGISSHIPFSELFALELEHSFLLSSINNVLTENKRMSETPISFNLVNFNYKYNDNGYPTNMTTTENKNIQITYKGLE